jgi:hypothetical protein
MKTKQRIVGILLIVIGLIAKGVFQSYQYTTFITATIVIIGIWLLLRTVFVITYTKTEYEDGTVKREIKL